MCREPAIALVDAVARCGDPPLRRVRGGADPMRQFFLGSGDPFFVVEVVLRTAFMFLYALALLRVMGKRGISQLTPFEYTIIVALGSAVGDPMFYDDVPVLHGCAVITTVVVLQRLLALLERRFTAVERAVSGLPATVVHEGRALASALARERLTEQELYELIRLHGCASVADVDRAVLEDSGRLSVLRSGERRPDPALWDVERLHARRRS